MIKYIANGEDEIIVTGNDKFAVEIQGGLFNREQLTELRHIIDQALNTSAEELGDD